MPANGERTPAEIFPPGEYIKDELEARGISQIDFSQLIKMPFEEFVELLAGQRKLTVSIAYRISQIFGTSWELWLNLEMAWRKFKSTTES